MQKEPAAQDYYLQVVKSSQDPLFPEGEADLEVGSQELGGGYIQYWAYPKRVGKRSQQLPYAEGIASQHPTDVPVILIDQPEDISKKEDLLELVLAQDGHAWAKITSSVDNLEDNLSELLEFGQKNFNMKVEHFMTTDRVAARVQHKLDEIEEGAEGQSEPVESSDEEAETMDKAADKEDNPKIGDFSSIRKLGVNETSLNMPATNLYANERRPSAGLAGAILTLLILAAFTVGVYMFKDQITEKLGLNKGNQVAVTPSDSANVDTQPVVTEPTATPTPAFDRSQYSIRVLNGTNTSGAAGELSDKLKALGWQIDKIGNASSDTVKTTNIKVKSGDEALLPILAADLSLPKDTSASGTLSKSDSADAEVTIGVD